MRPLYCEAHYILGRLCEDEGELDKAETSSATS